MPGQGIHLALSVEERDVLEEIRTDRGLLSLIEVLLHRREPKWFQETDKAWDAIHRCLTGGTLDPDGGEYPLSHAVLGGRHLHDEYYVVYVSAAQVRDVAKALRGLHRTWLRPRFDAIDDPDYRGRRDDADFEYTWDNFVDVQAFYERAAAAGRAVIFTAT